MTDLYVVKTEGLNVRSAPLVKDDNRIAAIALGDVVAKIDVTPDEDWWKISIRHGGEVIEGFVAKNFLEPAPKLVQAIGWFKEQFRGKIESAIAGTPFTLDLLTAIAVQETYYIWGKLYPTLPLSEVLKVCVGDTFDAPNRSAFPTNKDDLLAVTGGKEMFDIAREALIAVGAHIKIYKDRADADSNKFCRGFGIFQLDLQFFKDDPDYFLQKKWHSFDECLKKVIPELKDALKRAYKTEKKALTEEEQVYVAIAYNRGSVDFSRGFKQGHKDEEGKYYGEYIWEYLQLARSVP
ncbi:SH3 domain-containing protein [Oscillatoria sp. FACHB-1406]|nr:SH3 domain-containing protein [Oscillatoria sp. FACHB-1406]